MWEREGEKGRVREKGGALIKGELSAGTDGGIISRK